MAQQSSVDAAGMTGSQPLLQRVSASSSSGTPRIVGKAPAVTLANSAAPVDESAYDAAIQSSEKFNAADQGERTPPGSADSINDGDADDEESGASTPTQRNCKYCRENFTGSQWTSHRFDQSVFCTLKCYSSYENLQSVLSIGPSISPSPSSGIPVASPQSSSVSLNAKSTDSIRKAISGSYPPDGSEPAAATFVRFEQMPTLLAALQERDSTAAPRIFTFDLDWYARDERTTSSESDADADAAYIASNDTAWSATWDVAPDNIFEALKALIAEVACARGTFKVGFLCKLFGHTWPLLFDRRERLDGSCAELHVFHTDSVVFACAKGSSRFRNLFLSLRDCDLDIRCAQPVDISVYSLGVWPSKDDPNAVKRTSLRQSVDDYCVAFAYYDLQQLFQHDMLLWIHDPKASSTRCRRVYRRPDDHWDDDAASDVALDDPMSSDKSAPTSPMSVAMDASMIWAADDSSTKSPRAVTQVRLFSLLGLPSYLLAVMQKLSNNKRSRQGLKAFMASTEADARFTMPINGAPVELTLRELTSQLIAQYTAVNQPPLNPIISIYSEAWHVLCVSAASRPASEAPLEVSKFQVCLSPVGRGLLRRQLVVLAANPLSIPTGSSGSAPAVHATSTEALLDKLDALPNVATPKKLLSKLSASPSTKRTVQSNSHVDPLLPYLIIGALLLVVYVSSNHSDSWRRRDVTGAHDDRESDEEDADVREVAAIARAYPRSAEAASSSQSESVQLRRRHVGPSPNQVMRHKYVIARQNHHGRTNPRSAARRNSSGDLSLMHSLLQGVTKTALVLLPCAGLAMTLYRKFCA